MKLPLLIVAYLLAGSAAMGQHDRGYPVKVGEVPSQVLPREAVYLLPAFRPGTAFMRDGSASTRLFNYNFLLDEMHFIGDAGDTLAIADPLLLKNVTIDSMLFYYDKGYLREIFKASGYRLLKRQEMMQLEDKTRGAYDAPSSTSSIKTYGTIENYGQRYQLQVKKDVVFKAADSYYVADEFDPFMKANRKNFHLLFPAKDINAFIKERKLNLASEEDLKTLLHFCVQ